MIAKAILPAFIFLLTASTSLILTPVVAPEPNLISTAISSSTPLNPQQAAIDSIFTLISNGVGLYRDSEEFALYLLYYGTLPGDPDETGIASRQGILLDSAGTSLTALSPDVRNSLQNECDSNTSFQNVEITEVPPIPTIELPAYRGTAAATPPLDVLLSHLPLVGN
ncbi:hypothetical protein BJ878DRAFT_544200 [Calycina marina]|uniref:Uncharacterized protein n=1 Tax=Calycina marina TaxID=1763456 RepID=A0A9P7YZC3_9HELO|nr:hypothetical protein BJ878DRAFT_544200 [Calycina marina]